MEVFYDFVIDNGDVGFCGFGFFKCSDLVGGEIDFGFCWGESCVGDFDLCWMD